jgi:hypothetical protein
MKSSTPRIVARNAPAVMGKSAECVMPLMKALPAVERQVMRLAPVRFRAPQVGREDERGAVRLALRQIE